eukprot:15323950-Ditylum_brightwellii.AAC.1
MKVGRKECWWEKQKRLPLCVLDTVFLDTFSSSPLLSSKGAEEEKWTNDSTNKKPIPFTMLDWIFTSKSGEGTQRKNPSYLNIANVCDQFTQFAAANSANACDPCIVDVAIATDN